MQRRRHTPDQVVRKLREADRLLAEGKELPEVAKALEISGDRPRWGWRRAHVLLCNEGFAINRKRTQRLWRDEGLRVPQRRRKRRRLGHSTVPARRLAATCPDQVWAMDYQFDQTSDGR